MKIPQYRNRLQQYIGAAEQATMLAMDAGFYQDRERLTRHIKELQDSADMATYWMKQINDAEEGKR